MTTYETYQNALALEREGEDGACYLSKACSMLELIGLLKVQRYDTNLVREALTMQRVTAERGDIVRII